MSKVLEKAKKAEEAIKELITALEEPASTQVELSTLQRGEMFSKNGRKYKVLKQEEGQTKIISVDFIAENVEFDSASPDYKTSNLKDKIETDILPLFEEDFGSDNIVEHEVDLTTVDMQKDFGSFSCKVRPVTFDEAREFNDLLVKEDLPGWYWTCTPWSTEARGWKYSLAVVSPSGRFSNCSYSNSDGVRPVCILKSNIFVSRED